MKRITHLVSVFTAILLLIGASAASVDAQALLTRIWSMQITIVTANISDAGTDDSVSVSLNNDNRTWLNYTHDDFERGSEFTYELLYNGGIEEVSDITRLQFTKTGSDGWCLKEFTLRIYAFSGTYNIQQLFNSCRWLDNDNGNTREYTINNLQPAYIGSTLPYSEFDTSRVEALIESSVGHNLYDDPLYWDGDDRNQVEVTGISRDTLHVHLDLRYELNNSTNPSVDIDYDIRFRCNDNGRLAYTVSNIDVDVGGSIGLSTVFINDHPLIDASANRLRAAIARINQASCNVTVLGGGSIDIPPPPGL